MYGYLPLLRIILALIFLGYSCITDWKVRRAPNRLWYAMGGVALLLNLYTFRQNDFIPFFVLWLGGGVLFVYVLAYLIFRAGGFGGADAKALIAIALMFPLYPAISLSCVSFPVANEVISPVFALSVLGNAVVLTAFVPVATLAYNLMTTPAGELLSNPIGSISGYRAGIGQLKGKHLRLMHSYVENGGIVQKHLSLKGQEIDDSSLEQLTRWHDTGMIGDKVWVSPKLPFLIPITLGFLAGIFYGDILMQVVSTLLGR